jgi:hypothetical protein
MYFEILLNLPLTDLVNLCETNHELNDICNSKYFWQQKTFKDFGKGIGNSNDISWYQIYKNLEKNRNRFIEVFNYNMNHGLNNYQTKVQDATYFDIAKFDSVPAIYFYNIRNIHPEVLINGRKRLVPIIALPEGKSNFEDFVREIVGRSNYSQLVEPIIQDFNQQINF